MQTRICDIHAGLPDAKEDMSLNKREFMDSYVIPPRLILSNLISGNVCFIVGNKGLGKTAVLRYLNQYLIDKNSKTCSSFILFEQDYSHQKKTGMEFAASQSIITYEVGRDESLEVLDFSMVWRWHLYLTIIRDNEDEKIFVKDSGWKKFSRFVTRIFREEKQATVTGGIDLSLPENLPSLFNFVQPHISIEFPEFKIGRREYTFEEAMAEADKYFGELTRIATPYYIFIDELDVYYGDERNYIRDLRLVYDLVMEVKKMNRIFIDKGWQATKLFCTLRPEVIHAVDARVAAGRLDLEIDGYSFPLSWASDAEETYSSPLMRLLLKRIEVAENQNGEGGETEEERYRRWFPEKIEGMEPADYIKRLTWSRPRDVVRLLNAARSEEDR